MACRTTVVSQNKNSVPTDSGAFRSQFCGREIVNAVLIVGGVAFENAGRLRSRLRAHWLVYELTHRAPRSRRAAGSRSTRTESPESVATLFLSVRNQGGTASH